MSRFRSAALLALWVLGIASPGWGEPLVPDPRPFRVEVEVDDSQPYVHASVHLKVRLLAAQEFLEGHLGDPRVEGALVRRIGGDLQEEREIDGQRVQVIQREYAVAPEHSGTLRIEPVVFQALQRDTGAATPRRRSLFDRVFGEGFGAGLDGSTRPVVAASRPLALQVRPRPEEAGGSWWLPARKVELLEHWESPPASLRVGEPVRRHVILRAEGVAADQLPRLELPAVEGASQYAEPPTEDTRVEAGELSSVQVVESVLIPDRAGEVQLPALELSWWDTRADRARSARIPARSIQVQPGVASVADPPSTPAPSRVEEGSPSAAPGLSWIAPGEVVLFMLIALGGAGLALRLRRRDGRSVPASRRRTERALARACRRGDAEAAAGALRRLAQDEELPGGWVARAEARGQRELVAALQHLERVRYASHDADGEPWEGLGLWRAWRRAARDQRRAARGVRRTAASVLPGLYPGS